MAVETKTLLLKLLAEVNQPVQSFEQLASRVKSLTGALKVLPKEGTPAFAELAKTVSKDLNIPLDQARKKITQFAKAATSEVKRGNTELKEFRANLRRVEPAANSINALRERARSLAKEVDNLNTETTEFVSKSKELGQVNARLVTLESTTGRFGRNVGNYTSAFKSFGTSIASAFGVSSGIFLFAKGVKAAAESTVEFDQAQANLAAITGKSRDQIASLVTQANELGKSTAFTATAVLELQTELAKLGFDESQILQMTEAVENFAIAVDADASRAAAVAGSALRAFNLDASETERVVSTLAVATTKSALDFSKIEQALSTVAPVANSFGFTIEDTTALLGTLANAGFDASSSATATRNILLNLADGNGQLAKALGEPIKSIDDLVPAFKKLQDDGIDLAEALELTDKRSVAAFTSFISAGEDVTKLRDNITGVSDELKVLVDQRLNSFQGQTKLLGSAFDGVARQVGSVLLPIATKLVQSLTLVLSKLSELPEFLEKVKEEGGFLAEVFEFLAPQIVVTSAAIAAGTVAAGLASAATKAYTTAQWLLNAALTANPIGLVVAGIAAIVTGLTIAYNRSETFRAAISGVGNVASEVFKIIQEAVASFAQGFNAIKEGDIIGGLKSIGEGVVKSNPLGIVFSEGSRLKDAYISGFNDKKANDEIDKVLKDDLGKINSQIDAQKDKGAIKIDVELETRTTKAIADVEDVENRIEELNGLKVKFDADSDEFKKIELGLKELDFQLEEKRKILFDLSTSKKQLDDASGGIKNIKKEIDKVDKKKLKEAVVFDPTSLKALKENVSELKKELDTAPENKIQEATEKLFEAESKVKAVEDSIKELRKTLEGDTRTDLEKTLQGITNQSNQDITENITNGGSETDLNRIQLQATIDKINAEIAVEQEGSDKIIELKRKQAEAVKALSDFNLDTDISESLASIEAEKDAKITAVLEAGKTEKETTAEIKSIEAQSALESIRARLSVAEVGSAEAIRLKREEAEAVRQIDIENNAERLKLEQELRTKLKDLALQTAASTFTAIIGLQRQQDEQNTQDNIDQINSKYDREIELAEGNSEKVKKLEAEKEAKVEAIRKKAFEREKKRQLAEAVIAGALAVIKALASAPPPFNFALAASVGIATGLQIAAINAQQFGKGGIFDISGKKKNQRAGRGGFAKTGRRHSNNPRRDGNPILDGNSGRVLGTTEAGEGWINKKSMRHKGLYDLASAINSYRGYGTSFPGATRINLDKLLGNGSFKLKYGGTYRVNPNTRRYMDGGVFVNKSENKESRNQELLLLGVADAIESMGNKIVAAVEQISTTAEDLETLFDNLRDLERAS
jgi:TP901 family phage tail tape measure protein